MSNENGLNDIVLRFAKTRLLAAKAVQDHPGDVRALFGAGVAFRLAADYPAAIDALKRAQALQPANHFVLFELATTLEHSGRFDDAVTSYQAVLNLDPGFYKARYALVNLNKQTIETNSIPLLERAFQGPDDDGMRSLHMGHALAKSYEDFGDVERSFYWLGKAKERRSFLFPYDLKFREALTQSVISASSRVQNAGPGHGSQEPIFVCGIPRSGTTLVDRILSSHPDVSSVGEIGNFVQLFKRLSGSLTKQTLDSDTFERALNINFELLGNAYIKSTRPLTGIAPRFVDKAPSNYISAGIIAKGLPASKIVCVRRNPLDACLSNYKQMFAFDDRYYDYVYGLERAAHHYVQFDRLVKHWHNALPAQQFFEIEYERLVSHQEESTRELLRFCDLRWDPRCLEFHRNSSAVATPSAQQVRQAMYSSASGRWKKYGRLLDPAASVLQAAGLL